MKKILKIIFICVCLCMVNFNNSKADAIISLILTNNVEGERGLDITEQNVEIIFNLADQYFFNTDNIEVGDDVTSWFENGFPSECDYTVSVSSVREDELVVTFEGSIGASATISDGIPITINIPYVPATPYIKQGVNDYEADLSLLDLSSDALYIIKERSFKIAYNGPYTISGTVGQVLTPQVVVVKILDTGASGEVLDLDSVEKTLPVVNGLTPTIIDFDDIENLITIEYTGTPLAPSQDKISTTFPSSYMDPPSEDRHVPDRDDVKFDITQVSTPNNENKPTFIPPTTGVN